MIIRALQALLWATLLAATAHAQTRTLIDRATVIDGTGTPGRVTAVRIVGDRITAIGNLRPQPGETVIDARGLVLAPGFIDSHSHHDRGLAAQRDALAAVSQGITTIVVGQDGGSRFPLASFFASFDTTPVAVNVASYAGHGRISISGHGRGFPPGSPRGRSRAHGGAAARGARGRGTGPLDRAGV